VCAVTYLLHASCCSSWCTALTIKVLPRETKPALFVIGPGYSRLELGPLGHPAVLKDLILQTEEILQANVGKNW
jgi:hypothetical protein